MSSPIQIMSAADLASAFALRPHLFAWFLGAGASAASGIPTGYAMIRDFKTRIFCRETGYSLREVDSGDQLWIERIDDFFGERRYYRRMATPTSIRLRSKRSIRTRGNDGST